MQLTYNHRKKTKEKGEQSSVHHYQQLGISVVFIFFNGRRKKREEEEEEEEKHKRNYSSARYHSIDQISLTTSEGGVSSSLHFMFTFVS